MNYATSYTEYLTNSSSLQRPGSPGKGGGTVSERGGRTFSWIYGMNKKDHINTTLYVILGTKLDFVVVVNVKILVNRIWQKKG